MKTIVLLLFAVTTALPSIADGPGALYRDPSANIEARIDDLMRRMTPAEMVDLLATNYMSTNENPRLGIPALRMVDGSFGPVHHRSTAFPVGANLGASFDCDLVREVGAAIGQEARAKGDNTLLGPVIQIHRIPQAGRNAESYSEDPYLSGQMAAAHIRGVQSQGVVATAALLGKTQEHHCHIYDVQVDARTLHEIYLPPYRAAIQEGGAWAVMTAYNRVNGIYASNHTQLLSDILKRRWGFPGVVMTDWAGVENFREALYAGLDLDMPHSRVFTRSATLDALRAEGDYIDAVYRAKERERVRRLLRVMFAVGLFDRRPEKIQADLAAHQALALRAARESIVLLKNEAALLPLDAGKLRSVAVIGPNAALARIGITGASRAAPYHTTSPLAGVRAAVGDRVRVEYARGCNTPDWGDLLDEAHMTAPDGRPGWQIEYFNNRDFAGAPVATARIPEVYFNWKFDAPNPAVTAGEYSVRVRGTFLPPHGGRYSFSVGHGKHPVRFAFGPRRSTGDDGWITGWFTRVDDVFLEAGKPVPIELEMKSTSDEGHNALELRWNYAEEDPLPKAVQAAREADVALVFAGFNDSIEGEEHDRTPGLPSEQEELIRAVCAVNPRVVVILNAGSAVVMDRWESQVPAILHAFYPGQEGGTAVADILFGEVNPSGRLPCTIMRRWEDSPAFGTYPQQEDELVHLKEGIYVGYRWFDRADTPSALFTFGHGLSYTTFAYEDLVIAPKAGASGRPVQVSVKVGNTGAREGIETVQLYLGAVRPGTDRPVRELKGFRKVALKPGEAKSVEFTLPPDAFQFFEPRIDDWKSEPGTFMVFIGASSQDIRLKGQFELEPVAIAGTPVSSPGR